MTPTRVPSQPRRTTVGGFSLIELLVVIGIIGVLIAILVPTVTSMRTSAQAANSQQVISTLSSAIERYHADLRAYPGVFSNGVIANRAPKPLVPPAGTPTLTGPGLVPANITQSENLVLALLGGLSVNPAGTTFTYNPDLVGKGPQSLNPDRPKTFAAYTEAGENYLGKTPYTAYDKGATPPRDTIIPEFLDGYGSEPMPVIYMRARVGAAGIAGAAAGFQYDPYELRLYGDFLPAVPPAAYPDGEDTNTTADFATDFDYFKHPSIANTPVQKDGYILIAAGKDRKFGTKDDLTNFGGFK